MFFQEWYTVIDKEGKSKERYLFLFKARILVCKVRRISEDRSVFVLKDIIRVRESVDVASTSTAIRPKETENNATDTITFFSFLFFSCSSYRR